MTTFIHNGDIGTIFRLTIVDTAGTAIDVSGASTKYIYFEAPNGTKTRKDAVYYTDGTDGIIQYTSVDGDIGQAGNWKIQGYIEPADGKFFTRVTSFTVLSTLYTE
jgi:hypothetical protein